MMFRSTNYGATADANHDAHIQTVDCRTWGLDETRNAFYAGPPFVSTTPIVDAVNVRMERCCVSFV